MAKRANKLILCYSMTYGCRNRGKYFRVYVQNNFTDQHLKNPFQLKYTFTIENKFNNNKIRIKMILIKV